MIFQKQIITLPNLLFLIFKHSILLLIHPYKLKVVVGVSRDRANKLQTMITSLFLTIPPGTTYEQLKQELTFIEDFAGVTNWVMRFPRTIYSVDLKVRHTFTNGQVEIQKTANVALEERWKYFVITKSDGVRYYCTAQVYYERGPLKCKESGLFQTTRQVFREFFLPKCIVLLSQLPYYKIQVNLLKVFRQLKKPQPIVSHSVSQGLLKVYLHLLENQREQEWQRIMVREAGQSRKVHPSPQFTFNYYLNSCNQHKNGEAIYIQKATNREVLHLYRLHSHSLYEICYIFHLPFSPPTLRAVLSAILQQKQIIFTSNNQNLTTLIIQTLMRMILPFKWCYMYVPNLPLHLIQPAQQSFMPYIVGIHKKHLELINTNERVVVFVEEDRVETKQKLILFHEGLLPLLTYTNNDTKNYLQWEKQIRIKALLLLHLILQRSLKLEQNHMSTAALQQSRTSLTQSTVRFPDNQPSPFKVFPLPPTDWRQAQHHQFIHQLAVNSMMFKNFKQDRSRGLTQQTIQLLQVPPEQRHNILAHNFNVLGYQAQYPARFDNEKRWIRYYQRMNRARRKLRFNRYSLNSLQSHNTLKFSSIQSPMAASSIRLGGSRMLTQSTIFQY